LTKTTSCATVTTMADSVYNDGFYYPLYSKIIRNEIVKELEQMAEHPSMSADMQWALRHAAKMTVPQESQ
jgi:hypothetical protein